MECKIYGTTCRFAGCCQAIFGENAVRVVERAACVLARVKPRN